MKLPFNLTINFVTLWKLFRKYVLRKKSKQTRNFGLIPDVKDDRDRVYRIKSYGAVPSSTKRWNTIQFQWRYNQLNIGSCVGHGVSAAFRRILQHNNQSDFDPSRLFAYYIARRDKNNDTGASIRDAFKAINIFGLCSEELWPYIPADYAKVPSGKAFDDASLHQSIEYESVRLTKMSIMDALYNGHPVVFGLTLFESFMSDKVAKTGVVPYPKCWEEEVGGHCMAAFDYDEENVIVLNSWGKEWGQNGVCEIPWKYILNSKYAQDFWVFYKTE